MRDVWKAIHQKAKDSPECPAIYDGDRVVNYRDLNRAISALRARLLECPLRPGDHVGLFMNNCPEIFAAVHAVSGAGLTYVPLSTDEPHSRLSAIVQDAKLSVVLTTPLGEKTLRSIFAGGAQSPLLLIVDFAELVGHSYAADWCQGAGEKPLYMLYTSGSTGAPKGVLISPSNVACFADWMLRHLEISADDVFLAHSRPSFDLSVFHFFVPFKVGAAVRLLRGPVEQMYPGEILKRTTIAMLVPGITGLMLQAEQLSQDAFPQLRHVIFCGEKLLAKQANAWISTHPQLQVHNMYGLTETTVVCSYCSLVRGQPTEDPIPIGEAFPATRLEFLDEQGQLILGATEGELIIAGDQTSPYDYWQKPGDRFFDHAQLGRCFRTGDSVRRDADGRLYWLARLDDQIKSRGHRVELGEIETVLLRHPALREGVCIQIPATGELLFMFSLTASAKSDQVIQDLHQLSRENLPAYMRPNIFQVVENLPRSNNGKIDRRECRSLMPGAAHE